MRRVILDLWPVLLLLLLWQVWVSSAAYNSIVLVPPSAVLSDLLHFPAAYGPPLLHTLAFALGGLALGMLVGVLLALAAWLSKLLAGITTPFALLLSSTPVVCLIPVIARLLGYDSRTELAAIAVMTFFPSYVYCTAGLRQLPAMSRDVFFVLHASRWQDLRLLIAVTMQQFHLARALGASALAMALSAALFDVTRALEHRVSALYRAGS